MLNGIGIGSLPDYVSVSAPDLVPVLPNIVSATIPVYIAYVEELRHNKRVAAFRDFVLEEIQIYRKRTDSETEES